MTNTLKIVENAVRLAVPEIMEPDFGCFVERKHTAKKIRWAKILAHIGGGDYRVMERIDTSKNVEEYEKDYGHCEFTDYKKDSFEIIGRDITLEDCMKAVLPKVFDTESQIKYNRILQSVVNLWTLGVSLHKQQTPTINFLAEILKK